MPETCPQQDPRSDTQSSKSANHVFEARSGYDEDRTIALTLAELRERRHQQRPRRERRKREQNVATAIRHTRVVYHCGDELEVATLVVCEAAARRAEAARF